MLYTLLCNSETWALKADTNETHSMWNGRPWWPRNEDTRKRLGAENPVTDIMQERRLRLFEHVNRMNNHRVPCKAMFRRVAGEGSRGRQSKRWLDNVREDCNDIGLDVTTATWFVLDRNRWRSIFMLLRRAKAPPRPWWRWWSLSLINSLSIGLHWTWLR